MPKRGSPCRIPHATPRHATPSRRTGVGRRAALLALGALMGTTGTTGCATGGAFAGIMKSYDSSSSTCASVVPFGSVGVLADAGIAYRVYASAETDQAGHARLDGWRTPVLGLLILDAFIGTAITIKACTEL